MTTEEQLKLLIKYATDCRKKQTAYAKARAKLGTNPIAMGEITKMGNEMAAAERQLDNYMEILQEDTQGKLV